MILPLSLSAPTSSTSKLVLFPLPIVHMLHHANAQMLHHPPTPCKGTLSNANTQMLHHPPALAKAPCCNANAQMLHHPPTLAKAPLATQTHKCSTTLAVQSLGTTLISAVSSHANNASVMGPLCDVLALVVRVAVFGCAVVPYSLLYSVSTSPWDPFNELYLHFGSPWDPLYELYLHFGSPWEPLYELYLHFGSEL